MENLWEEVLLFFFVLGSAGSGEGEVPSFSGRG